MIIVYANWFDVRLIRVFGVINDAGAFVFPLTFLLSDIITEVYGYKHARRAIWTGFLFNCIFLGYGQIVIHVHSSDLLFQNDVNNVLLYSHVRIIAASVVSYVIAEPLNSFLLAKLKHYFAGKYMGVRFLLSTFLAASLDSALFIFLGFYGAMSNEKVMEFITMMWAIKVLIEIIMLPLAVHISNRLKQIEKLDIYDTKDSFNVFKLDTVYKEDDNYYSKLC